MAHQLPELQELSQQEEEVFTILMCHPVLSVWLISGLITVGPKFP